MENFIFQNPTKIIFGKNIYKDVGKIVKKYGEKILLHYEGGGELIRKIGIYQQIVDSLDREGIEYLELGGVIPNPDISLVYEGIDICKSEKIDFILAIGGGSVIDSAKAISLGTVNDVDVWDFFTKDIIPTKTLGVGVILTIPGSGSEMSESIILSNEKFKMKRVCDSEINFPKFSMLNPEVCYTIPKYLLGCGITDILSHLMERYFSKSKNTELSDALLEAAMRVVVKFGEKIINGSKEYNDYAQIMWAATIAHNGMISCGRVADWASHRIEHEISAIYNITHGEGMAIVFLAWIKYMKNEKSKRLEEFFKNVFLSKNIEDGIEQLKYFFEKLGMKTSLKEKGIDEEKFEIMAEKALFGSETIGRFKALSKEDIINILKLAK